MNISRQTKTERFILKTNPLLYVPLYRLDSGSTGGAFTSADGHGYLCTVTGALWTPQGRAFDGDDKIAATATGLPSGSSARTLLVWFKRSEAGNASGYLTMASYGEALNDKAFGAYILTGSTALYVMLYGTDFDTGAVINDTNWHFLAVSYDGTNVRIYVDSAEAPLSPAAKSLNTTSSDFYIGAWVESTNFYKGTIGEVILYNRALTPLEIQNIYQVTAWRYGK